jgi:uncharacterized membrane protein YccC
MMSAVRDRERAIRRAQPWRPSLPLRQPQDPGLAALRRAARAALVIPLAVLFGQLVVGDPQNLIFIVFGCFALLVMADFGGPRSKRSLAYLGTTIAGALLVALGTLASPTAFGAALVMLVVGFWLAFTSIFGGYVATARTGLLLAFVISLSIPGPASAIPARVGGWMLAGLLSTLAAAFLWPRTEQAALPKRAAEAVVAVAEVVRDLHRRPALAAALADARRAVQAARREYAVMARRPAGLTRRDRAYFELFSELDQVADVAERPFPESRGRARPRIAASDRLAAAVLDALRASAAVLTGGAGPDLAALDTARKVHRAALNRWVAGQLREGRPAEEVLDGIDDDHTLRVISYLAIGLGGNAVIAAGRVLETEIALPAAIPRRPGAAGVVLRLARTVRTHLEPQSAVLHNSLRLAVGLALSVLLARTLGLNHAFWVVLGTLQVLRTSALGTGRTTVQAIAGSVLGFAVGGLFVVLAGNDPALMWAALPITIFLAAYATTTVGFVVSQAAFNVNLIVVFNLISPAGWQVGLVRIEDVVVGATVSVVAGVLLWPRGARRELSRSVASFYRAAAAYLAGAFDALLGFAQAADAEPLRRQAVRERDRAGEALYLLISEQTARHLDAETAVAVVAAGNQGMLAGDLMTVLANEFGPRSGGCPDGAAALRLEVRALLAGLNALAERLDTGRGTAMAEPVSAAALRSAALGCLNRWAKDAAADRGALAVVIAREWALNLARLQADLEQPVTRTVKASRIPWWR